MNLRRPGHSVVRFSSLLLLLACLAGTLQAADFSLSEALQKGREFEQREQWVDALSHYDDALRQFPKDKDVKMRQTLAQIHVDLDRRYADSSFVAMVSTVNQTQALDLFQEIALKVQSHYVTDPEWQRLTWRGTANLDVALSEKEFIRRHLPNVSPAAITTFRNVLRNDVNKRLVRDRNDARNLVTYAGKLAHQQLGLPTSVATIEYCCGAIGALDSYSTYLTADQLDDVYNQIEGNFVGLGIELKAEEEALLIVNVIPNGPAEKAGIVSGDRIIAVDGKATREVSTDTAADMLKGDKGSFVTVDVQGTNAQVRRLQVRRDRVDVPSVEHAGILDSENGVAYFELTSFQKTTSRDVDAALWKLHRDGMKSLIVDLRGNPGGLLTASVEVADKFLNEGTIVSTRGRSPREDFDYRAHRVGTWQIPLFVLIDRDTASASEIFAGAIRDQQRGLVFGERSYGKGSVQGIFPLNNSRSGVRLTTAKFYSPSGAPISNHGVLPNREVRITGRPNAAASIPLNEDPIVAAAVSAAQRLSVAHR